MSTFDGVIREFPEIRVDFFRGVVDNPPLACFLSHIHSDHLAGLDTYKGRPVYCSAATRAMLLKLQRYSSRINFHQKRLEKEEITYKHQNRRLKSLPLEAPTEIELEPGNSIRVTLFNANHCPGAVMFLFEGKGKAVLYTGDIRSEPWHVDSLARSPCMIEYASGLKTLDKVYLDTSFTEDVIFQTKAQGLRELIDKVSKYPKETKFYFSAWTYGYEEVWIALAKALDTQIHVDDYKLSMYKALQVKIGDDQHLHLSPEASALNGFACGNRFQPGLLTRDETVRLHSCEKGTRCSTMAKGGIVFITPIVAHLSETSDLAEVGIGGGAGDLDQDEELILSPEDARTLLQSVNASKDLPQDMKESLPSFLLRAASGQRPATINLPRPDYDEDEDDGNDRTDLQRALRCLAEASGRNRGQEVVSSLPNRIKFPYSRHSSYRELCHLLEVLRPRDIWPCTVDHMRWIKEEITIQGLFGDYCTSNVFDHDQYMARLATTLDIEDSEHHQSQTSVESAHDQENRNGYAVLKDPVPSSQATSDSLPNVLLHKVEQGPGDDDSTSVQHHDSDNSHQTTETTTPRKPSSIPGKRPSKELLGRPDTEISEQEFLEDNRYPFDSQGSSVSAWTMETRQSAFDAMLCASSRHEWAGLLSTTNHHSHPENELGEE